MCSLLYIQFQKRIIFVLIFTPCILSISTYYALKDENKHSGTQFQTQIYLSFGHERDQTSSLFCFYSMDRRGIHQIYWYRQIKRQSHENNSKVRAWYCWWIIDVKFRLFVQISSISVNDLSGFMVLFNSISYIF